MSFIPYKIHKLTVLDEAMRPDKKGKKYRFLLVLCDCGVKKWTHKDGVLLGRTKSCGCYNRTKASTLRPVTHGHTVNSASKTYRIWCHIKNRCFNPKCDSYPLYGGRGITMCDRWLSFKFFLNDMGECPVGMSIDRIDVNLGYFKDNCRWATNKQQANNRRSCKYIEFNGERKTEQEWAESLGFKYGTIIPKRMRRGWTLEETLTTRKQI